MKLMKATTSYKLEMEKNFPNHWPIKSFNFWADYWFTFGSAPTLAAWEQFDSENTAPCVNKTGNTPAQSDSMQAAHDLMTEVKTALHRINRATKCSATRFVSGEGLQAAEKLQNLLHVMEGK